MSVTYRVEKMRFIVSAGKVAERNPDRLGTIAGVFFNDKGEKLSFSSKEITREIASNSETVIDIEKGILTLPAGERGRKPSASASQDEINSLLDSVREVATK